MIRVLTSPFAAERLAAAKEFVRSFPAGSELLLIGADRNCVDDLVRDLSSLAHATFGLHRFSLAHLATRLALPRLAKNRIAPASALGLEAVVARAAHDALTDHQLQYFSPVADCSGFVRAASATLHELRMSGVSEGAVRAVPYSGPDNAALLSRFEKYLTEAGIADRALVFRTASESIRTGTMLTRLPTLLLDVVIHSALEGDLISALAESSPHLLITIPAGDVLTSNLVAAIPNQQQIQPRPIGNESSLARLGCYLFSDNTPPEGTVDEHVVFMSAAGQERECVEIARLIVEEAKRGVRFDTMAVLLRSPDKYVGVIQSAFRRAEIPAYFSNGNRRPHPAGRALLALLHCAMEGLSVHRFSEYLSFAQVPSLSESGYPPFETAFDAIPEDEALGFGMATHAAEDFEEEETEFGSDDGRKPELAGSLRTPWKWEEVLVEAAVIGGKERWARRLRGIENQFRLELEVLRGEETDSPVIQAAEQKLLNLQHLSNFALPLIDTLASMPKSAKWGDWLTILENLAVKALRRPERVLTLIAEMNPMAEVGPLSLNEVLNVLKDRLANIQQQSAHHRYGQVFIGTHEQARGHSFEIVFVPGLAERMFPQKLREDPLLLDELRKQLSGDLLVQFGRGQMERSLLQVAVGAATRRLYLSYPRVEIAEPRPRVPSSYALDVIRAITGRIPDFDKLPGGADPSTHSRLSWPAPDNPSSAIDDAEFDLAVLRPLISMPSHERKGRFAYVKKENDHLLRSLRSRWSRWDKEQWRESDGLCTKSPTVLDILKTYRLNARPYSVSALQMFAVCPYQFFLFAIHGLRSKPERHALQQIDPITRGHLFHKVQATLLRQLQRMGKLPITDSGLAEALTLLTTTLDEIALRYYDDLSPAIDQVWRDGIERMRGDLRGWLHSLARDERWQPIHFEFAFGFGPAVDRDPASLPAPAVLSSGHRLHGIVDLIERSADYQDLRITDHKTGSNDGKAGAIIAGGESLQPVLYSLAVESVLNVRVTEGRLSFCTAAGGFSERVVPINQDAREKVSTLLGIIDGAIENAFLVPAPKSKVCTHCRFITVCGPYEEIRISSKRDQSRLKQLQRIRKLR